MDSDKLSLAHINAIKINKSNQVHIILHAGLFFVKYILVRKYILNYKLKKLNTDDERGKWDSKSNKLKIKITLAHQHTITGGRRNKIDCTYHLKHKKCFELLTTNNMKLIKQIHNTWVAGLGSFMSLHKKQGGRRGRMNFTERAHVFSTPNVTFWNQPEDFLATDSIKNSTKMLQKCAHWRK